MYWFSVLVFVINLNETSRPILEPLHFTGPADSIIPMKCITDSKGKIQSSGNREVLITSEYEA